MRDFIASLVGSLAWPTAVVVVLFMFRATLRDVMNTRLRRVKGGAFELEFDRALSDAHVGAVAARNPAAGTRGDSLPAEIRELAKRSPMDAILEGQRRLEGTLRQRLASADVDAAEVSALGAPGLVRRARELGLVDDNTVRAVEGLAVMHTLAANRPTEVTVDRAIEFLSLADVMLHVIGNAPVPDTPPVSVEPLPTRAAA